MDSNALSKQADEALYLAKRSGRNRVEIHQQDQVRQPQPS